MNDNLAYAGLIGWFVGALMAVGVVMLVSSETFQLETGSCIVSDNGVKYVVITAGKYGFVARNISDNTSIELTYGYRYRKADCFGAK